MVLSPSPDELSAAEDTMLVSATRIQLWHNCARISQAWYEQLASPLVEMQESAKKLADLPPDDGRDHSLPLSKIAGFEKATERTTTAFHELQSKVKVSPGLVGPETLQASAQDTKIQSSFREYSEERMLKSWFGKITCLESLLEECVEECVSCMNELFPKIDDHMLLLSRYDLPPKKLSQKIIECYKRHDVMFSKIISDLDEDKASSANVMLMLAPGNPTCRKYGWDPVQNLPIQQNGHYVSDTLQSTISKENLGLLVEYVPLYEIDFGNNLSMSTIAIAATLCARMLEAHMKRSRIDGVMAASRGNPAIGIAVRSFSNMSGRLNFDPLSIKKINAICFSSDLSTYFYRDDNYSKDVKLFNFHTRICAINVIEDVSVGPLLHNLSLFINELNKCNSSEEQQSHEFKLFSVKQSVESDDWITTNLN